ncbi:hypothetical protein C1646_766147 [Rhizophagus diaphanus]|nr:hypothetical protein C1646_766147 [Rhizophagus diaphanus] [Rhizophagus sp. MUCL 43196]
MAELQEKVSQYIGIKSSEIRLPITEEDRQEFRDQIHIGWLLGCTMANAEKVLINPSEDLSEKILAHIQKRFEEVPLVPVLIW